LIEQLGDGLAALHDIGLQSCHVDLREMGIVVTNDIGAATEQLHWYSHAVGHVVKEACLFLFVGFCLVIGSLQFGVLVVEHILLLVHLVHIGRQTTLHKRKTVLQAPRLVDVPGVRNRRIQIALCNGLRRVGQPV